jgi:photosystem II stability/assembly factor-like uncharacterized protein
VRRLPGLAAIAALLLPCALMAAPDDYTRLPALPFAQPSDMQLLDVVACDYRLLAVGERGAIIYSDDNGRTWQQAEVPVSQTLTAVTCGPSSDKRWAVGHGGLILGSEDAGVTWRVQFDGNEANRQWLEFTRQQLAELEAAQAALPPEQREDLALDVEDATFAVEDAELAVETGPADPFLDVWFKDAFSGFAVGAYGMMYRTENGGVTWTLNAAGVDNPDRYHYYGIAAAGSTLFLCGEAGILYRSVDGGDSWETLNPGYAGSFFGLLSTDTGAMLVFGLRGNILRSDDKGSSWRYVNVVQDPQQSIYDGTRLPDGRLILSGAAGTTLSSNDGGATFVARIDPDRVTIAAITQAPSGELVLAGMSGLRLLPAGTL